MTGMPREEGQRKTQGTNAEGKQASATLGQVQRDAVHVLGVVENEERQARAVACRAQAQGRGHREDAWRQALHSSLKLPAASRQLRAASCQIPRRAVAITGSCRLRGSC